MIHTNIQGFINDLEKIHIYSTDFTVIYNDNTKVECTYFDEIIFTNNYGVGENSIFKDVKKIIIPAYQTGGLELKYLIQEEE